MFAACSADHRRRCPKMPEVPILTSDLVFPSRMSQFSDSVQNSGPPQEAHLQKLSIFGPSSDLQPKQHVSVSNLTKNLMSSLKIGQGGHQSIQQQQQPDASEPLPGHPPLYNASEGSSHGRFLPGDSLGSKVANSLHERGSTPTASSFSQNQNNFFPNNNDAQFTPTNGNMSYIPLGHNTPTVVLSSYTSNYSYTPSFHNSSGHQDQAPAQFQGLFVGQSGFLSSSYKAAPGVATTNVSMDSANPNLSLYTPSSLYRNSFLGLAPFKNTDHYAHLLPNTTFGGRSLQPALTSRFSSDRPQFQSRPDSQPVENTGQVLQDTPRHSYSHTDTQEANRNSLGLIQFQSQGAVGVGGQYQVQSHGTGQPTEPDHYMTYKEYLDILNKQDVNNASDENGYEEHLNIVDYPVNELITMLACLLTKIIEANDKLHPNHFDNTIAVRQKLKEQKKMRRMQRERNGGDDDDMNTVTSLDDQNDVTSSDDEEDELKNRYLANVLAFHGTNIPGISLHAYLTRVLKYCPVTNEVFLSLLVYFDRIARKANNLQKKKKEKDENEESEQLFVMDSYNIHRLIILGITVSSKFFSDIFYKNLRYAKVGGLPLEELNYLELQFLLLLDFKLMISVEDLQNYGDLLLKFWKREQLANELMNGAKNDDIASLSGQS